MSESDADVMMSDRAAMRLFSQQINAGITSPQTSTGKIIVGDTGPVGPQGPAGPQGAPGPEGGQVSLIAGQALLAGQVVYVSLSDNKVHLANAGAWVTSQVIGLAGADISSGFAVNIVRDQMTLSDWTSIIGASSLSPGYAYFLGLADGTLTMTAPSGIGEVVVFIGFAVDTQNLVLQDSPPILL